MKDWLRDLYIENRQELAVMGVALGLFIAGWLLVSLLSVVLKDDIAATARCRSMQGEYGGGKCFKDGEEM